MENQNDTSQYSEELSKPAKPTIFTASVFEKIPKCSSLMTKIFVIYLICSSVVTTVLLITGLIFINTLGMEKTAEFALTWLISIVLLYFCVIRGYVPATKSYNNGSGKKQ